MVPDLDGSGVPKMATQLVATQYGPAALDELRSLVGRVKAADPLASVTVVVPNHLAGIVVRRDLAVALGGVAALSVTTLPRLAEQLTASTSTVLPVTRSVLATVWRSVLDDDPGLFGEVAEHRATVRALVRAHGELRDLSPAGLEAVAGSGPLGRDVVRLHRAVVERLGEGWRDATELLLAAAARLGRDPQLVEPFGEVVLFLPQDLSRAECALAAQLRAARSFTVVAGLTGQDDADAAIRRTLRRIGGVVPLQPTHEPAVDAGTVLHASDSDDEVRCVVRRVVEALGRAPAHRVAVLYGSEAPYARLLHEHLAAAGVTINGPGVLSVRERAVARGFLGILALSARDLPRGELFTALSHAPVLVGGRSLPLSRWERASRAAGVVGGGDWTPRLERVRAEQARWIEREEAAAEPHPGRLEAARRTAATAAELQAFVEDLQRRLAAGARLDQWGELSRWALDLFGHLYGSGEDLRHLPPAEQYAVVAIEQSLAGLAGLARLPTRADVARLCEVLELDLEAARPRVGRFGEGVFVGPLRSGVGLDLDEVFVVGLAEDACPGQVAADALLPERVRAVTAGELPSSREAVDAVHRHLLVAFASAAAVTASFPRGDLRRNTWRLPSRWLLPSLRRLGNDPTVTATGWNRVRGRAIVSSDSFWDELRRTALPATEQEWRLRALSAGQRLADPVVDAAVELLAARGGDGFTRFDGNLTSVAGLPDYVRERRTVAPTMLEAYAECPHAFFARYLLRVRPIEEPEEIVTVRPVDSGLLVHACLDRLVERARQDGSLPSFGEPWSATHRAWLGEILTECARELEDQGLTGHPRLWQRERELIAADLQAMLSDDDAFRAGLDAAVLVSELRFGRDGEDPVEIALPVGGLLMSGSADLVEITRTATLVVLDLKTGSSKKYTDLEQDPVVHGTRLQLPVYAHAARRRFDADRAEARYWFVRKERGKRIPVVLDEQLERRYADTLTTIVTSIAAGRFPAKPPEAPDVLWVQCRWCNPDGLGHGEARERYERKRTHPALAELVALIDPGASA